jgi:hypothetical protein
MHQRSALRSAYGGPLAPERLDANDEPLAFDRHLLPGCLPPCGFLHVAGEAPGAKHLKRVISHTTQAPH